jgi:hypothetical protein
MRFTVDSSTPCAHSLPMSNTKNDCKHCGTRVNLDDEGVQYPNGTCAHDHCNDGHEYNEANASDLDWSE